MTERVGPVDYRAAGVDVRAAEALGGRLRSLADSTRTECVMGGVGGFAARFRISEPGVVVASADGVGTKVLVAIRADVHHTIGEDLVNHCVNDLLAEGAEPLFFLDYFACGKLDPRVAGAVVEGVARGCRANGCALIGGETAEMPDVYRPGEYDLAGFIVGRAVFSHPRPGELKSGDRLIALASNGLHTNGYSLVRRLLFDRLGLSAEDPFPDSEATVAEVLLKVHRSYLNILRPACGEGWVRALAHVTGGGIPGNLERVLPPGLDAVVALDTWDPPEEFRTLARLSGLEETELCETFNMGVGMIAVVSPADEPAFLAQVGSAGCEAWECGRLERGTGEVHLEGGW